MFYCLLEIKRDDKSACHGGQIHYILVPFIALTNHTQGDTLQKRDRENPAANTQKSHPQPNKGFN